MVKWAPPALKCITYEARHTCRSLTTLALPWAASTNSRKAIFFGLGSTINKGILFYQTIPPTYKFVECELFIPRQT